MRLTRFLSFSTAALSVAALSAATLCCVATLQAAPPASWPQWRGPNQNGVAPAGTYPAEWAEDAGVRWKQPVEGRGGSTPVIAGDLAFLTSGIDGNNSLLAFQLNEGGKVAWKTEFGEDTKGKHKKGSGSNPSPVTDGEFVFAYYRSGDLGCARLNGEQVWHINLQERYGDDTLWWDLGSSPTLIDNLIVIAVMQSPEKKDGSAANRTGDASYLVAFNRKTGEEAWKVSRELGAPSEAAQSYTTPIAIEDQGLIAVMGADHLTIHSAKDGHELGRVGGFNPGQDQYFRSISSPVVSGDIVVCPYARGETITACKISDVIAGKGRDSIVWERDDLGSDVPTPAIEDGRVYVAGDKKRRGIITALDLKTGKTIWEYELDKSRIDFSSSPLVAQDHLYITAENGTTFVVGPLSGTEPRLVSTNPVGDDAQFTVSSMVPYNGTALLQRTRNMLYLFGK
ncbi:outer membrane protein assembly factor BamB family protein [Roseiconus lacunae]|uniref:outer membrane protein assembly factor BamB family protein n=1 Tax=Roseiconus lacunae TaxID=2605694 RepID=UPI0011F32303|nr:PQQ-binding-like beta-propeller repeat protein [Roseiconus lacunae]MCD0460713.1 PQQ-binding-like beta-propeller repeat protein [Roseiconus lacunae]